MKSKARFTLCDKGTMEVRYTILNNFPKTSFLSLRSQLEYLVKNCLKQRVSKTDDDDDYDTLISASRRGSVLQF